MRSFIFSQCRDFRTVVIGLWEDFGVLASDKRVLDVLEFSYLRLWKIIVQWVAVVEFRMNDIGGDGTGISDRSIAQSSLLYWRISYTLNRSFSSLLICSCSKLFRLSIHTSSSFITRVHHPVQTNRQTNNKTDRKHSSRIYKPLSW